MVEPLQRQSPEDLIKTYKLLLSSIIDKRPSGTRQRLADTLGKHRSFISQITSIAYPTPVPEKHLAAIFSLCHFSSEEQKAFLAAYDAAHPDRAGRDNDVSKLRTLSITVDDLGSQNMNQKFDEAITEFAHKISRLMKEGRG